MRVMGLITARGGSVGVPRKNVRPLGGRPLIAWTVGAAKASVRLDRIIVSTDDAEIAKAAADAGAEVPFLRPGILAGSASPHIDVVVHALDWLVEHETYRPEYVLLLQPTSPFRTAEDIDGAIALAVTRSAKAVIGVYEPHDHPMLMRKMDAMGRLESFVECPVAYPRRQDLPTAYAINGAIFLNRADSLRAQRTFYPVGHLGYPMPPERSMQIDSEWDLTLAQAVVERMAGRTGVS